MLRAAILSIILVGIVSATASAQSGINRYQPARPALSPYMDYFRRDTGMLDRYNTFIAPGQAMRQRMGNQQQALSRTQQQLQQAQGQLDGLRRGTGAPTGVGASFFNYSHFYRLVPAATPEQYLRRR